jgi:xanthine dehydrogenase accessory factor
LNPEILRLVVALLDRRAPFAVATVVATRGSVPGKVGARMIVHPDGSQHGTVGGAGLEANVKRLALEAIGSRRSGTHRFDLARQKPGGLDSVCGGSAEVFVEYMAPRPHLLILGGGHVGLAVGRLCEQLEYAYSVADVRPEFATAERFPGARARFSLGPAQPFEKLDLSDYSHLLVIGHDHHVDGELVVAALKSGFKGSLGVIGSKTKRLEFRKRCADRGIEPEEFDRRVQCPIGLAIGAETPEEIAVAILGEIIRDYRAGADA